MFGRIRSSPSPVELLELERLPSKLLKHDSLSIYESTLVKLKQGSQRNLSPTTLDSMEYESNSNVLEDSPKVSGLCGEQGRLTSCNTDSSCISVSSSPNQEQKTGREISIHCLFSKYANSRQKQGATGCNGGSSVSISTCSSDSESTGCSRY
ncbi:uncharacterized protein LOC110687904 [Chenopodium quinoa]|uniref:uncharacterized protein LOC110687904 n=1 Tax=Chenopodium quinoa TaxID=63459 RepID=UPI000B79AB73|nr:uncharacterized protein LOC110687904 [Chenopodium quinoa]